MPKVIIVEDEESYANALVRLCGKYQQERGVELSTTVYDNPAVFLQKYHGDADMVLLDILMPQMNGMECARRLRKRDENVLLCFVTSMAQYAIQGYEVGAVDFILKPVSYDEFSLKMDRMLRILRKQSAATVLISTRSEMKKIDLRDLSYVEVFNHSLLYHTTGGDFEAYGKLSSLEEDPRFCRFVRISPSHLVNCAMITSVQDDSLLLGDIRLPISRRRRKECMEKMAAIFGGSFL